MIPLFLQVAGFLSYRQPVEIDFRPIEVACISGANGAGKSSLLDAITWVLFGAARKRDDSLINSSEDVKAARVSLTFAYEGNTYRIDRTLPRNKTSSLDFLIAQDGNEAAHPSVDLEALKWKTLTAHSLRETQKLIEATLRMDYETFTNASFFLQGKADQFTIQTPANRKKVLGSILGLESWEKYREKAVEKRRLVENEWSALEGQMLEIEAELGEEDQRRKHLAELEKQVKTEGRLRQSQEELVKTSREKAAALEEQAKYVANLQQQVEKNRKEQAGQEARLAERHDEKRKSDELVLQEAEIERDYSQLVEIRRNLEEFNRQAEQYQQVERKQQALITTLREEKARLEQELRHLQQDEAESQKAQQEIDQLEPELAKAQAEIKRQETELQKQNSLRQEVDALNRRLAKLTADLNHSQEKRVDITGRLERLRADPQASTCPLCGQPLDRSQRSRLIAELENEAEETGALIQKNITEEQVCHKEIDRSENELRGLVKIESEHHRSIRRQEEIQAQLRQAESTLQKWQKEKAPRYKMIAGLLEQAEYLPDVRQEHLEVEREMAGVGYDAKDHAAARASELELRPAEKTYQELLQTRATRNSLEREIKELEAALDQLQQEKERLDPEYQRAEKALQEARKQIPNLARLEQELLERRESEDRARMELGAARQKVDVLEKLKERKADLTSEGEVKKRFISDLRQLERAFGKDGVPALLIEQALPQIEDHANETLQQLSNGDMYIRFQTQAEYKDKDRADKRETLDILISDRSGTKDYELYSGGEAFRVNFAIRLALAEVLAQRAGARLQTLVIDEGFGSQDQQGRQKLIESIHLIKGHFAKILVITHIEELKEIFPHRIEVEKGDSGSMVKVY